MFGKVNIKRVGNMDNPFFELRNQHIQGFENTDMFLLKNSWRSPYHLTVRGSRQSRSQRSQNLVCAGFVIQSL